MLTRTTRGTGAIGIRGTPTLLRVCGWLWLRLRLPGASGPAQLALHGRLGLRHGLFLLLLHQLLLISILHGG